MSLSETIFRFTKLTFSQVHPIPSYDDPAALRAIVDRMEQVGLYLMYDMRLYVPIDFHPFPQFTPYIIPPAPTKTSPPLDPK
jgi:hypothetical protein